MKLIACSDTWAIEVVAKFFFRINTSLIPLEFAAEWIESANSFAAQSPNTSRSVMYYFAWASAWSAHCRNFTSHRSFGLFPLCKPLRCSRCVLELGKSSPRLFRRIVCDSTRSIAIDHHSMQSDVHCDDISITIVVNINQCHVAKKTSTRFCSDIHECAAICAINFGDRQLSGQSRTHQYIIISIAIHISGVDSPRISLCSSRMNDLLRKATGSIIDPIDGHIGRGKQ